MKYDFDLDLVHNNSLTWIMDQVKTGTTVLEFGPATGRLTKYLKEDMGCKVYLVEIDEDAGKQALEYGVDLVVGDAEKYEWLEKYKDIRFDHIIFADVLEHLRDPEALLVQAKRLLKVDGSILLSVPNLAHNSVLINLLNNRFEYTSVGLLDNTHIHMFTKESLENMLSRAGLFIEQRYATYCKVGTNEIVNSVEDVKGIDKSYWLTREYGEVYQFVYAVRKSEEYVQNEVNNLVSQNRNYYAQVFYNLEDVKEELSERKYFVSRPDQVVFNLDIEELGKVFRFDPLNKECFVKIHVEGAECINHNACIRRDEYYLFDTEDPVVEYKVMNDNTVGVVLRVEYISMDSKEVAAFSKAFLEADMKENELITQQNELIMQQQNELVQMREANDALRTHSMKLEEHRDHLEGVVQELSARISQAEASCAEKEATLENIYKSKKWRLINIFGRK